MKSVLIKSKFFKINLVVILIFSISSFVFINKDHSKTIKNIKLELKDKIKDTDFKRKQSDLQNTFKYMYEGARTISMLPSVRQIQGDNRNSAEENVVKLGRFSQDAETTVQEIYNNMADNVSVSEVYAVLEGLDYKKGQVPFFTYDSLILDINETDSSGKEMITSDTPEEEEKYEYEYFSKQIEDLKKNYGSFNFKSIDDIPSVLSPVLRTCDNTQYTSISKGNVKDSYGILYSIPFYGFDDKFKGVISVIFRTNVLEAKLLDVPFLIITDNDKIQAKKLNFSMPNEKSNYLLYNEKYNIYIYDRRNTGIVSQIQNGLKNNDNNILTSTLNTKTDGEWKLAYFISDDSYNTNTALQGENKFYTIKLVLILIVTIAAIFILTIYALKKDEKLRLKDEIDKQKKAVIKSFSEVINQVAKGNLNVRIETDSKGDLGNLAEDFDKLTENLSLIIYDVKVNSNILAVRCQHLDDSIHSITKKSQSLTNNASSISMQLDKLSETVGQIHENSVNAVSEADITKDYAAKGSESINNTIKSMRNIKKIVENSVLAVRELDEKSKAIEYVITVISTIAKQTNLLALNASIEASRAGESGQGFQVVAAEIKKLAEMTTESTGNIEKLISDAQQKSNYTLAQMELTNKEVEQGVLLADEAELKLAQIINQIEDLANKIDNIKNSTKKQTDATNEIARQEEEIAGFAAETNTSIETCVKAIEELTNMAVKLKNITSIFY